MGRIRRSALTLVALLSWGVPDAHGQVFLASKPSPAFTIGPLFVRTNIGPELGPVTIEVLWSLVLPSSLDAMGVAQDLYLLWRARSKGTGGLGLLTRPSLPMSRRAALR